MKVHLSRFVTLDAPSNLQRMEAEAREAAEGGADLVVFPEGFLQGYTQALEPSQARARFKALSGDHPETLFVFGTISEDRRNRLTAWTQGREAARYDKVHLFLPNGEGELWEPGDRYAALRFRDWTLGFLTCNDVRFPEQARALRLEARVDALVVPAWWPWRRDGLWSTLLRARAIENGVFALGCCVAASEHPGERFAGAGNHAFGPLGDPLPTADDHTYHLDRALLGRLLVDPLLTHRPVDRLEVFPGVPPGAI